MVSVTTVRSAVPFSRGIRPALMARPTTIKANSPPGPISSAVSMAAGQDSEKNAQVR